MREKDFLAFNTTFREAEVAEKKDVVLTDEMIKRLSLDYYNDNFSSLVRKMGLTNYEHHNIIPFFYLERYRAVSEGNKLSETYCHAMITIRHCQDMIMEAGDGDGIVDAICKAASKALERKYPQVSRVEVVDFKATTLDGEEGSNQEIYVMVEFSDGENSWITVGISTDLVRAACKAVTRSMNYFLLKDIHQKAKIAV